MGRPKKSEIGPIPTKERILQKALELFADKGYDAVPVRAITSSLNLNQATLYLYFKNKDALLDAIFDRLHEKLIKPGFNAPPVEFFKSQESFDLAEFLIEGAKRFFSRADEETRLTWRILMTNQYRYESAHRSVVSQILDAPAQHFTAMLENMQTAEKIKSDVDPSSAGRMIASIILEYSFRANLEAAWEGEQSETFNKLCQDLRSISQLLA